MAASRKHVAGIVVGLVVVLLCGCTPRPPGFVAVGRDQHGTTVGAMVVCSDPPDRAALVPTAHLEESAPARRESASWQFKREALRRGSLMTWPLFGSTDRDSIRSLTQAEVAPEDAMSLYVQRDPQDGASGIDFTVTAVDELPVSQFLYTDSNGRLRRGDEADMLNSAHC